MNIFATDTDPWAAAISLGDRHVSKMILEAAQMMCSAFPAGDAPYKRTHYYHPCSVWARERFANYEWLYHHGKSLSDEFSFRFEGRTHKSGEIIEWCWNHATRSLFASDGHMTPFAQAMPDEFRGPDPVEAYRRYYRIAKSHLHTYTRRNAPQWL